MSKSEKIGQLSLLLGFLLFRISSISSILAALVILDVLIVNGKSLVNLGTKS